MCVKGYRNENEICKMDGNGWGTASGRDKRKHRGGLETKMYRFYGLVVMWSEWINTHQR